MCNIHYVQWNDSFDVGVSLQTFQNYMVIIQLFLRKVFMNPNPKCYGLKDRFKKTREKVLDGLAIFIFYFLK
jgi:hypothetical protein